MITKNSAPTMIDTIYRISFSKQPTGWRSNAVMREHLMNARRFVLDDDMSSFLGDLTSAAFAKHKGKPIMLKMIDGLRVSARLPHHCTWIEYNLRRCQKRSAELLGLPYKIEEIPSMEGWLLEQHPQLETVFKLHVFTSSPGERDRYGFDAWTFPIVYAWSVNDDVCPYRSILPANSTPDAQLATGVMGYETDAIRLIDSDLLNPLSIYDHTAIRTLILEWVGVLRRCWALLATINDIPILNREVVPSHGFIAKGSYRKFLTHKTITLQVPKGKDIHKIARDAVAIARRRGHPVRGHHRIDWLHRPAALCDHQWSTDKEHIVCSICHGRKLWIREHNRGDASLGFVTHSYKIEHPRQ